MNRIQGHTLHSWRQANVKVKFWGGEGSRALRVAAPPCSPITIEVLLCASVENGQLHRAVAVAVMWCGAGARKTVCGLLSNPNLLLFYHLLLLRVGVWVCGCVGGVGLGRSSRCRPARRASMGKFMTDLMPSTSASAGAVSLSFDMAHCRPLVMPPQPPPPPHMHLRGTVQIPPFRVHRRCGMRCMQHPHPKFTACCFSTSPPPPHHFPPPAFPAVYAAVTPACHARGCMLAHGLNAFLVLGMHAALCFVLVSMAVQASVPATAFSSGAVDLKRLSLADRQGQVRAPAQLRLMTRTGLRLAQRKAETGASSTIFQHRRVPPHIYTTIYSHVCALLTSCPRAVPSPVLAGCGTQMQLTLRRVGTFVG